MKKSQNSAKSAKQVINAKVAAAKAAAEGKVQAAAPTTTRAKQVVDAKRVAAAEAAITELFEDGEALNTCSTIKQLTRLGFKPLEIIAATGFNKVTVYRQSAEANFVAAE